MEIFLCYLARLGGMAVLAVFRRRVREYNVNSKEQTATYNHQLARQFVRLV